MSQIDNLLEHLQQCDNLADVASLLDQLLSLLTVQLSAKDASLGEKEATRVVNIVIPLLKNQSNVTIPALMILNTVQAHEVKTPQFVLNCLNSLLPKTDSSDFIKIITQVSHLMNDLIAGMFVNDTDVTNLVTNEVTGCINNSQNETLLLDLFSSLALNDQCKSIIGKSYKHLLYHSFSSEKGDVKIASALVAVKVWKFIDKEEDDDVFTLDSLSTIILTDLSNANSIEALSLIASNPQIKNKVGKDSLQVLIDGLVKDDANTAFGILTILEKLSMPLLFQKKNLQQLTTIKDKNDLTLVDIHTGQKLQETEKGIVNVSQFLIDKSLLEILFKFFKKSSTTDLKMSKIIKLITNLIFTPNVSIEIDQKSHIIKSFTAHLMSISIKKGIEYNLTTFMDLSNAKFSEIEIETRLYTIRGLTHLLISSQIEQMFNSQDDIYNCLPFILEFPIYYSKNMSLVTPFNQYNGDNLLDSSDIFTSLGAITNLLALTSETPNSQAGKLVFSLAFDSLVTIWRQQQSDAQINSTCIHLFTYLIQVPLCMAKFFNWSQAADDNFANFELIVLNFNSSNDNTISMVASVAHLGPVAERLATYEPFVQKVQSLLAPENHANEDDKEALRFIDACMSKVR